MKYATPLRYQGRPGCQGSEKIAGDRESQLRVDLDSERVREGTERCVWPHSACEKAGKDAQDVADDWFFETAIRLHRAGEGAPYTGLKPAGLSEGPVVPKAEKAIETGDPKETIGFILKTVEDDLTHRFHHVMEKKKYDVDDVAAGREFIEAFIGWVVYSHHLYMNVKGGGGHGEEHGKKAGCGHH